MLCVGVFASGADFINVLNTAFTPVASQSVRTQSSCQYFFTLLGSTGVKAVRRTLMKLSPDVTRVKECVFELHSSLEFFFSEIKFAFQRDQFQLF